MRLFILAGCLLLLSYVGFLMPNQDIYLSEGERLVNETLDKTARVIHQKYHLHPAGEGVAMHGGPIRELFLSFTTKGRYTQEELRRLVINCADELVNQVNINENIQPFLFERPFTIKNTQIVIFNYDKNGSLIYDPEIANVEIVDGMLTYLTEDPEDRFKYKTRITETYEEALEALQSPFKF
jgi:hypothetical protein